MKGPFLPSSIYLYEAALILSALLVLIHFFQGFSVSLWELLLVSVVLFFGYRITFQPSRGSFQVCFVFPLILASILIYDIQSLYPIFVARFVTSYLLSRGQTRMPVRFAFTNASSDTLSAILGVFVLMATKNFPYWVSVLSTSATVALAQIGLFLVWFVLRTGEVKRKEILQHVFFNLVEASLAPMGALLALCYFRISHGSALLFLAPIAVGFLAFRFAFRTQEEKGELSTLYDTTSDLNGNMELGSILSLIVGNTRAVFKGDRCAIFRESREGSGHLVVDPDDSYFSLSSFRQNPLSCCLKGETLLTSKAPEFPGSLVAVPLQAGERVLGVLAVHRKEPDCFYEDHLQFLTIMAGHATRALVNAELFNETVEAHTRLEEAHTRLKEAQAHLVQSSKLAAVGQLAAGVAHEINNPLAAILINAQGLQRDPPQWESWQRESVENIATGTKRCKAIVERLLKFSRLSEERKIAFSAKNALQEALDLLANQLALERIALECLIETDALVSGNPLEFSQIVTNLVLNSRDAVCQKMDADSEISGQIRVSLRKEEGVILKIGDNGIGIEPVHLSRIFEPFYTTKPVGKGVGLGLSLSYRAVEKMEGRISVESIPGEGTTFTVWFPEALDDAAEPSKTPEATAPQEENAGLRALEFLKEARKGN
ncbi:MAG: GAF domain-containing protein [Armatimonadetes bacterium]|nr:GAF domain-containing protein [Armatimonadota bacterium]